MIITKENRRVIYENLFKGAFPLLILGYPLIDYCRGCPCRQEGLQRAEARGARCPQLAGHQGDAEPDLQGPRQDPILMAVVLLHPHPRGRRVPP